MTTQRPENGALNQAFQHRVHLPGIYEGRITAWSCCRCLGPSIGVEVQSYRISDSTNKKQSATGEPNGQVCQHLKSN